MKKVQSISGVAQRIRQKLIRITPPVLDPVDAIPLNHDDEEEIGQLIPVKSLSTKEDGSIVYQQTSEDKEQQEQLEVMVGVVEPTIRMITSTDDIDKGRTGLLFVFDNTCAAEILEQSREVVSHIFNHHNEALTDLDYYALNICESPRINLALDYKGPEVIILLEGFPQSLRCQFIGVEVELALVEKLGRRLVEVLSTRQAFLFSNSFESAVIGVYEAQSDPSYRLISQAAILMKDADLGIPFCITCATGVAKQLVPCESRSKSYIAIRRNRLITPFIGPETLKGLIMFLSTEFGFSVKVVLSLLSERDFDDEAFGNEGI